jgi:hypothetical protein
VAATDAALEAASELDTDAPVSERVSTAMMTEGERLRDVLAVELDRAVAAATEVVLDAAVVLAAAAEAAAQLSFKSEKL